MGVYQWGQFNSGTVRLAQTASIPAANGIVSAAIGPLALSANTGYFLAVTMANAVLSFTHTCHNASPADAIELCGRNQNVSGSLPTLPANLSGFSRNPDQSIWLAVA
jgi:hypothetical protein